MPRKRSRPPIWRRSPNIGSFEARSSLSTWLTRIVVNEALGRRRADERRRRHLEREGVALLDDYREALMRGSEADAPDVAVAREQIRRLLEHAVADLPDAFRTVFVLREIEGLSSEETADVLDVPVATVKTRLFRSRRRLQETLAPELSSGAQRRLSLRRQRLRGNGRAGAVRARALVALQDQLASRAILFRRDSPVAIGVGELAEPLRRRPRLAGLEQHVMVEIIEFEGPVHQHPVPLENLHRRRRRLKFGGRRHQRGAGSRASSRRASKRRIRPKRAKEAWVRSGHVALQR